MADKAKDKDAKPNFEKDLEGLETIVAQLEEGGLPLDESIKRFEDGIKLWKRCEQALSQAEKRIEILTKGADGDLEAEPFDPDNPDKPAKAAKRTKAAPKAGPVDVPDDEIGGSDDEDEEDDELLF